MRRRAVTIHRLCMYRLYPYIHQEGISRNGVDLGFEYYVFDFTKITNSKNMMIFVKSNTYIVKAIWVVVHCFVSVAYFQVIFTTFFLSKQMTSTVRVSRSSMTQIGHILLMLCQLHTHFMSIGYNSIYRNLFLLLLLPS